ncbi:MAG: amidohydrolase [Gemmatimonadales bacterium]|jgi:predicted amidohydrolase YtcJ
MRRSTRTLLCWLAAAAGSRAARAQGPSPADLIVTAQHIYTVDPVRPVVGAFAVRDGRIVFAGSEREAMALKGPRTRLLALGDRTVIPGITDAHLHLLGVGTALRQVDLTGTRSYDEVIQRVVARAHELKAGEWIGGRGWNQNAWPDTRFPTHDALSRAVPDNPVVLERVDGHAVLANARAMEAAGVTAATPDPAGGRLARNPDGSPTGVFVDNAMDLVWRVVPPPSRDETRAAILAAVAEVNRWGLTGVHDPGVGTTTIDLYEELARAGRFSLRDYVMVDGDSADVARAFQRGPQSALYDGHLWVRAIKQWADGALGSRGAALLEDYSDEAGNRGYYVTDSATILATAISALRHGFQLCVHAIGDRANRMVLNVYEEALDSAPTADHRFRIEHAQIVTHEDIPRFAALGVIPSMQTSHQTSDMYWAMNRLGWTRVQGAYAWRSLLNTGVIIPNGTDAPVERVNPMIGFHAAITRQDADGWPAGGWFPAQRMTREEALEAMTIWPAYAGFMEGVAGSLTPGKYADFTVLDQDIMTVAPERILATNVVMTVLGGQTVYERSGR